MSKIEIGPVVLGGNVFGWTVDRNEGYRILDAFVDRGGVSIDTADLYPAWVPGNEGGESEQLIGEWLALRKVRSKVTIATKVAKWQKHPGLSPANIRAAVEGSLARLRTDYIDLYYAHEDDEQTPQADYLRAFDALVREGKVRALGASNFSAERLTSALRVSDDAGLARFEYSQDHYNLLERKIEPQLLPRLIESGVSELPYWSLAAGFLTGKYRPGASVQSARAGGASAHLSNPKALAALAALDDISGRHGVSVAAVALAWLRAQPGIGAPIASARTVDQLTPLFESSVQLSAADVAQLSATTGPAR